MQLLLPITVLVLWTFIIMLLVIVSRVYSVRSRQVKAGYFKLYQNTSGKEIPAYVIKIGRNYGNLLEVPPLFYFTCLLFMYLNQIDQLTIFLAWSFVIGRVTHSLIHISFNHVLIRLSVFAMSCAALFGMWLQLIGKNFL